MTRKVAGCQNLPNKSNRTLTMSGEEGESSAPPTSMQSRCIQHKDTQEVHAQLHEALKD